jgi:outer membrane protein OmpA-like peptidoglycan-associated protein
VAALTRAAAAALALVGIGFATAPAVSAAKGGATQASALKVSVDKTKVDLKAHRLEVRMSRPAGKVKITVHDESNAVLADEEQDFSGRAGGTPLIVTWNPSSDAAVGKIELRAYGAQGNWVGVEIAPWFVNIPHDDVNFRTDSSDIDAAEVPKVEAAFGKIEEALAKDQASGRMHAGITLYIAGHTDTVGSPTHNFKLSQDRARSIGAWFRKRGVRLPIAYEGYGETALKVRTADNVDEPRNRRADYILSDEPPMFKTTGFRPAWKKIP